MAFIDTYLKIVQNPAKHLKRSKKKRHVKIIIVWNYFPRTFQYVWQGIKNGWSFEYSRVLNMSRIVNVWVTNIPGFIIEVRVGGRHINFWNFILYFRYLQLWTSRYFPEFTFLELFVILLNFRVPSIQIFFLPFNS